MAGKDDRDGIFGATLHFSGKTGAFSGTSYEGLFGTTVFLNESGIPTGSAMDMGDDLFISWENGSSGSAVHLWDDTYMYQDSSGRTGTFFVDEFGSVVWDVDPSMPFSADREMEFDPEFDLEFDPEFMDEYALYDDDGDSSAGLGAPLSEDTVEEYLAQEGLDYDALSQISKHRRREAFAYTDLDYDDFAEYFSHLDEEQLLAEELEEEGLDVDELMGMCLADREEAISDMGLDYEDYAVLFVEQDEAEQLLIRDEEGHVFSLWLLNMLKRRNISFDALCRTPERERIRMLQNHGLDYEDFRYLFRHFDAQGRELIDSSLPAEEQLKLAGLSLPALRQMSKYRREKCIDAAGIRSYYFVEDAFRDCDERALLMRELTDAALSYAMLCTVPAYRRRKLLEEKGLPDYPFKALFSHIDDTEMLRLELKKHGLKEFQLRNVSDDMRILLVNNKGLPGICYNDTLFSSSTFPEREHYLAGLADADLSYTLLAALPRRVRKKLIAAVDYDAEDFETHVFPEAGEGSLSGAFSLFGLSADGLAAMPENARRLAFTRAGLVYDPYALLFEAPKPPERAARLKKKLRAAGLDYEALSLIGRDSRESYIYLADLDLEEFELLFADCDNAAGLARELAWADLDIAMLRKLPEYRRNQLIKEKDLVPYCFDPLFEDLDEEKLLRQELREHSLNEFLLRNMPEKKRAAILREAGLDPEYFEGWLFSSLPDEADYIDALAAVGLSRDALAPLPQNIRLEILAETGYDAGDMDHILFYWFAHDDDISFEDEFAEAGLDLDVLMKLPEDVRSSAILGAGLDPERYALLFSRCRKQDP